MVRVVSGRSCRPACSRRCTMCSARPNRPRHNLRVDLEHNVELACRPTWVHFDLKCSISRCVCPTVIFHLIVGQIFTFFVSTPCATRMANSLIQITCACFNSNHWQASVSCVLSAVVKCVSKNRYHGTKVIFCTQHALSRKYIFC